MIDQLLELNDRVLLAINGAHTGFLDSFMMIATNRWTWVPLYVTAFVYLIYRYAMVDFRMDRAATAAVMFFLILLVITVLTMKVSEINNFPSPSISPPGNCFTRSSSMEPSGVR